MKVDNIKNYTKGWFIGKFIPTLHPTSDFEIAVKDYNEDDKEKPHYHKIATEYTIILSGKVNMNGKAYFENDIIIIEPNEVCEFEALTDCKTLVVKVPCMMNDKFEI